MQKRKWYFLAGILVLLDALVTLVGVELGACELNPIMAFLLKRGPGPYLLVKGVVAIILARSLARGSWAGRILVVGYVCLLLWQAAVIMFLVWG